MKLIGKQCGNASQCPAVYELASGEFLIVGSTVNTITVGANEGSVVVPRDVMLEAAKEIVKNEGT
jgi:hypothetical protein